jgi:hypothetical protein
MTKIKRIRDLKNPADSQFKTPRRASFCRNPGTSHHTSAANTLAEAKQSPWNLVIASVAKQSPRNWEIASALRASQ